MNPEYERFHEYFSLLNLDEDYFVGFKYCINTDSAYACIEPKSEFLGQNVYFYKPQLLDNEKDKNECIYYFIPLETLKNLTEEQFVNTISIFVEDDLIKKCKIEKKLNNINKDF